MGYLNYPIPLILKLNISCFENSLDPDYLGSVKPTDPHCLSLCLNILLLVIINSPSLISGRRRLNGRRKYFTINLHKSMGPGRDQTHHPWISNQTHYRLCYGALRKSLSLEYDLQSRKKRKVLGKNDSFLLSPDLSSFFKKHCRSRSAGLMYSSDQNPHCFQFSLLKECCS